MIFSFRIGFAIKFPHRQIYGALAQELISFEEALPIALRALLLLRGAVIMIDDRLRCFGEPKQNFGFIHRRNSRRNFL